MVHKNVLVVFNYPQIRILQYLIAETHVFNYYYFQFNILEWRKLDMHIRRSDSFLSLKILYKRFVGLQLNQLMITIIPLI